MAANRLFRWSLATFHAGLLVLLLVIVLYSFSDLAGALKNVGTIPGLAIYLALWTSTWWTTGKAARDVTPDGSLRVNELVRRGMIWGGVNGAIFVLVLLAYLDGLGLSRGQPNAIEVVPFLLIEAAISTIPAFIIGAIVGLLFALLDLGLLGIAQRILPGEIRGLDRAEEQVLAEESLTSDEEWPA
ncbi:MAG: hypothetical protein M3Z66_24670 [Chloroflexota bacterium]|nr:hypothetical protein [Chloroflexota bacterium]